MATTLVTVAAITSAVLTGSTCRNAPLIASQLTIIQMDIISVPAMALMYVELVGIMVQNVSRIA